MIAAVNLDWIAGLVVVIGLALGHRAAAQGREPIHHRFELDDSLPLAPSHRFHRGGHGSRHSHRSLRLVPDLLPREPVMGRDSGPSDYRKSVQSRPASSAYRDGYDRTFGKKKRAKKRFLDGKTLFWSAPELGPDVAETVHEREPSDE
jgi:hypothetical protein